MRVPHDSAIMKRDEGTRPAARMAMRRMGHA